LNDAACQPDSVMATTTTSRTAGSASTQADVVLLPNLKNCLLNLPSSLVTLLLNSNTIAQNVVVEVSYRQASASAAAAVAANAKSKPSTVQKSVFLGWTGMPSQSRLTPIVGRDGIAGSRGGGGGGGGRQEQEVSVVEMDATFGRLLGLSEGMKV